MQKPGVKCCTLYIAKLWSYYIKNIAEIELLHVLILKNTIYVEKDMSFGKDKIINTNICEYRLTFS